MNIENLLSAVLIALALAMDAFAVSVSSGIAIRQVKWKHALKIAAYFGGFQALMPVIGWWLGIQVLDLIRGVDHWIAFGLLAVIGGKMIRDARQEENRLPVDPLKITTLLLLAVSTSIDALAVGITFSVLAVNILPLIIIIGSVTFCLSAAGSFIGGYFGHIFEEKLEIAGGLILIGLGIKILIEHLVTGSI
jgi:putative Mn2+ efflux pump MntP